MLRVKVELIPHGRESAAEVLDEVLIENDGSGVPGGENEGGVGNYNIFPPGETLEHLHVVDYPSMYACGRVEGLERTPKHRILLAELALGVAREAQEKAAEHGTGTPPLVVRKVGPYGNDYPNYPA